jgi:hypothetical protein
MRMLKVSKLENSMPRTDKWDARIWLDSEYCYTAKAIIRLAAERYRKSRGFYNYDSEYRDDSNELEMMQADRNTISRRTWR